MSTINGRDLKVCFEELRAFKPKTKEREAGGGKVYKYHAFDEYMQRMDACFGNDHYQVEMDDFKLITLASGQQMPTVRCVITIFDDDGNIVAKKSAYGGSEVMANKSTGLDYNFGNLPGNAGKDAFKMACELFGIFGVHLYDKEGKKPEQKAEPKKAAKEPEKDVVMNLLSEGAFIEVSEKEGKKTFRLRCREKVGKQVRTDLYEVLFYPNQYGADAQKFNDFYGRVTKKATTFRALLKPCGDRENIPQYAFKGFAK